MSRKLLENRSQQGFCKGPGMVTVPRVVGQARRCPEMTLPTGRGTHSRSPSLGGR